jgi:uncharacterized protein (TIGR02246 family)
MLPYSRAFFALVKILFLGVITACSTEEAPEESGPDREADVAAIRGVVAAYQNAVNSRDGTAVGNLYTADGDMVLLDSPRVRGRDSITAAASRDLPAMPATQQANIVVTNIRFLTPGIAIVETVATFTEGEVRENRGTSVLVRENGTWLHAALRVFPAQRAG